MLMGSHGGVIPPTQWFEGESLEKGKKKKKLNSFFRGFSAYDFRQWFSNYD
jgi:hypothetical protein